MERPNKCTKSLEKKKIIYCGDLELRSVFFFLKHWRMDKISSARDDVGERGQEGTPSKGSKKASI